MPLILPPPPTIPQLIPLLQKIKDLYQLWYQLYKTLPKEHRYTLGAKIDNLLVDLIEAMSAASFLPKEDFKEKLANVKLAVRKNDAAKLFLMILWETKSLDNKKYLLLSEKINEIGRMSGGWAGQLSKQNSPAVNAREK